MAALGEMSSITKSCFSELENCQTPLPSAERITEMSIVSDRFDMTLSLLILENTHSGVGLDGDVDEGVFDRIERSQNRRMAR